MCNIRKCTEWNTSELHLLYR